MLRQPSIPIALVLVAGLMVLPSAVRTQGTDLDRLDDRTILRDLDAELDDIYADFAPDTEYPLGDLKEAILDALSDEGDDGLEEEITMAELEQEMREDGTTLERVVEHALVEADALAFRQPSQRPRSVQVGYRISPAQRRTPGRTTTRQAIVQTEKDVLRDVRAR